MSTGVSLFGVDSATLLSYYQSKLPLVGTSSSGLSSTLASANKSATADDKPPWEVTAPAQTARDAQILATTNFVDTSNVPHTTNGADAKTEQDNQKLFSLYTAVSNLAYLAGMSNRSGMTDGQMAGFNTRFQTGLQQIQSYISSTDFNNFTLQAAAQSSSVTSTAGISLPSFSYNTRTLTTNDNVDKALPGLSTSQSFTVTVNKNGVSTDVPINLSGVNGPLTLNNVISYVNQQLSDAGFKSRFQRTITKGTIDDPENASYGLSIAPSGSETVSLSAAATPSLYVAGNSGLATRDNHRRAAAGPSTNTAADQQGRLIKLTDLSGTQQSAFSATASPDTGLTTAQSTVVDSSGNVYVVGNATGDFGDQLNQGTQDTYLTKYDSAGQRAVDPLAGRGGHIVGLRARAQPEWRRRGRGLDDRHGDGYGRVGRQHRQFRCEIRFEWQPDLDQADPDAREQSGRLGERGPRRECLHRRPGPGRTSARARPTMAAPTPMSPSSIARAISSTKSNPVRRATTAWPRP